MTAQERVDELQDLSCELEIISGLLDSTRDLYEFLLQETDDTNLSEEHLRYHYKRISILANVIFDRIVDENDQLKALFDKTHEILCKD